MVTLLLFLLFIPSKSFPEQPWGKDSSLVTASSSKKSTPPSTPFQQAILFHQQILSPADGPRSHFYPSSSEYGKKAISQWGSGTGLLLTFDRLMRENRDDWHYSFVTLPSKVALKYDPVPKKH